MTKIILYALGPGLKGAEHLHSVEGALKMTTVEEERIHEGKAWYYNAEITIPSTSTSYFAFVPDLGDGSIIHLRLFGFVSDQGPMKLHFTENAVLDVNSLGSPLDLVSLNRTTVNTPGMALYSDTSVDVNSLGEHLGFVYQPESAPGNQSAGGSADNAVVEWVLNPSNNYLFSLENTSNAAATVESRFFVYREDAL